MSEPHSPEDQGLQGPPLTNEKLRIKDGKRAAQGHAAAPGTCSLLHPGWTPPNPKPSLHWTRPALRSRMMLTSPLETLIPSVTCGLESVLLKHPLLPQWPFLSHVPKPFGIQILLLESSSLTRRSFSTQGFCHLYGSLQSSNSQACGESNKAQEPTPASIKN